MDKLIVSSPPHIMGRSTTMSIMLDVIIALLPATVASVILFGLPAFTILAVCVSTAVVSEFLFNLIVKKDQTIGDLSAVVTGLLLGLNLPASAGIWHCIVGSVFAIVVVKCVFGGIGCNFANPAITARVFLLVSFSSSIAGGTATRFAELTSGATPLYLLKNYGTNLPSLSDMFLGIRGGAIGETCALALILGFVYLVARRVINWEIPVIFVGTVFVLSLVIRGDLTVALYEVLGGGLLIGAIFMATDYVSSPVSRSGKRVFALGCGLVTVLIRFYGGYPEGVSFAILLMNILSPYIEKMCRSKPLGGGKNA